MSTLKQRTPVATKRLGRRAYTPIGQVTAPLRLMPTFILAGAQRCGTTSLYRALLSHPAILSAAFHKGVNYFDVNYHKGMGWYRGHFPLRVTAAARTRGSGQQPTTFDASGYYMYHPLAAARIGRDMDAVKVLVLLRDPVQRAYSAYKHEFARGFESESFEQALKLEDGRVQPELERMISDPTYQSDSYRHHSYRRRGQYSEQLQRIVDAIGREQLLVVESEAFFTEPEKEYQRILDFLGLPPHQPASFDRWNARPGSGLPKEAEAFLVDAYRTHDEQLIKFLGRPPRWMRQ